MSDVFFNGLAQTGVIGIVLAWFMLRQEEKTEKLTEAINNLTLAVGACPKKDELKS